MKTTKDIVERLRELDKKGMEELMAKLASSDLFTYLSFEEAKEFVNPEALKPENIEQSKIDWEKDVEQLTEKHIIDKMKNYMTFALDKASNHRGLSANRSVAHFEHWLWLIEDQELLDFINQPDSYSMYGCPILKKICEKYDMIYPTDEVMQRMARGEPCIDGCEQGCG